MARGTIHLEGAIIHAIFVTHFSSNFDDIFEAPNKGRRHST